MTKLRDYRHPAQDMNETQMEIAVDELRRLDEDEIGMYAYNIIESVTAQIIEAEDGLNESSLEFQTMSERHEEWREMECENAVRVNGCEDSGPYYDVPWVEGPIPTLWTERWCSACIEESPVTEVEDGEAVWYPEGDWTFNKITGPEANKFSGTNLGYLVRNEDEILIKVNNDDK